MALPIPGHSDGRHDRNKSGLYIFMSGNKLTNDVSDGGHPYATSWDDAVVRNGGQP